MLEETPDAMIRLTGTEPPGRTGMGRRVRRWATKRAQFLVLLVLGTACSCSESSPTGPSGSNAPVNCAAFPDSRSSAYVLPYAVGQRFEVTKTFNHYTPLNQGVGLYAIDFGMPLGTPVLAVRSGTVVAVEERFSDEDRAEYHENWVMIRHADDTVARYIHLTTNGASVDIGDIVAQGQVIGRSGSSGPLSGPHLHLDVQTCGPNLPPGYNTLPCGMTIPLSFRNAESHSCGLDVNRSYTALAVTVESR